MELENVDFARYTRSYIEQHPEERGSIQQEHRERVKQGVERWNEVDKAFKKYIEQNDIKDAYYDFKGATLLGASFRGATFSADTSFDRAKLNGIAFSQGAKFYGDVSFCAAQFHGGASFDNAQFSSKVEFNEAKFYGDTSFTEATFNGDTYFRRAEFNNRAYFKEAEFRGNASFNKALFSDDTFFNRVTFSQEANFFSTSFDSPVAFNDAECKSHVPDFEGCQFKTAPLTQGFKVPWQKTDDKKNKVDYKRNIERYRKLKKMAIDAADHEQEVKFFAYEMRCKRYLKETAPLAKLAIILYYRFSNFGQSITKLLTGLFLGCFFIAFFTTAFLLNSKPVSEVGAFLCEPCHSTNPPLTIQSKGEAIFSQTMGLVFPVAIHNRITEQEINQCLYGGNGAVPFWNRMVNNTTRAISLFLLFLFGLTIRNYFKIK